MRTVLRLETSRRTVLVMRLRAAPLLAKHSVLVCLASDVRLRTVAHVARRSSSTTVADTAPVWLVRVSRRGGRALSSVVTHVVVLHVKALLLHCRVSSVNSHRRSLLSLRLERLRHPLDYRGSTMFSRLRVSVLPQQAACMLVIVQVHTCRDGCKIRMQSIVPAAPLADLLRRRPLLGAWPT